MIVKLKKISRPLSLLSLPFLLSLFVIAGCAPAGTTVPRGWSGGVIAGGTLYIGSMDGKLVALNITDGRRVRDDVPLETATVAIYGSPAVAGDLIYLGGYNGKFYAFAPGKLRWVYPRDHTFVDSAGKIAPVVGGAVVAQGKVFFGVANGIVYALDATTGDHVWEFPTEGKIWSTPEVLGDTLFIGSLDKKLYALDTATGVKKWVFDTQGAITAPPLVHDNTVYIGSFDRNLYALDAATGREKWRFSEAKNWFWAKPMMKDNTIYAGNLDGKVYVLDTGSGNRLAEIDLGGPVNSSPVLVGNLIIAANEKGVVYSLNTETKEKRQLRDLAEKVDAPLAADGEVVYIHTGAGKLYAVNAQSGAELWSLSLKSK